MVQTTHIKLSCRQGGVATNNQATISSVLQPYTGDIQRTDPDQVDSMVTHVYVVP